MINYTFSARKRVKTQIYLKIQRIIMKPIYKSLALAAMTLQVSLALNAQAYDGETTSETALPAEVLDSLRVELIAPNVSGARDLIKSGECTIDGSDLSINLSAENWIKGATYRLQVVATFGTQTQVIYALDVTVPYYKALASEPQEYEDTVTVVSTIGDGDKSGADATVYAKDGNGNAHITTPLSVGVNGSGASIQAASDGTFASGYADNGAEIEASGTGAVASGYADNGASINGTGNGATASGIANGKEASIQATSDGAVASGFANGDGAIIKADGAGTVASGFANGEGASIQAMTEGAVASGVADETNGNVEASGQASQAFGIGVKAMQNAQMVVGKCNVEDEDNSFQFIVGNGTDDEHRHNAFAVTKSGELALFEADGTPVILNAATLKALIASLQ